MYTSIPENTVDEDSVDGPCTKRKCETHTQEAPLKLVKKSKAAKRSPKHAQPGESKKLLLPYYL